MNLPGWKKISLYRKPLLPAYAYISPSALTGKPAIFIDAGIHGDEPAPILAVLQSEKTLMDLSLKIGVIVIPICNPIGYLNKTRYIDANPDWDNSAHSVGDMGHLLGWYDNEIWKAPTNLPDNPYCEQLAEFATNQLSNINIKLILDLHEDDHRLNQSGSYIYQIGRHSPTEPVLKILSSQKTNLLHNCKTRFGEKIINGVVKQVPNASFPEYIQELHKSAIAYTIETTTSLVLETRIEIHQKIIANSLKIINY